MVTDANLVELSRWSSKVRPTRLDAADPEALRIVGYSAIEWLRAPCACSVLEEAAEILKGATPAGHYVQFDLGFLQAGWKRAGLRPPVMDRREIDTMGMAAPLAFFGQVESLSLESVTLALGIERERSHRALPDALACLEIARILRTAVEVGLQHASKCMETPESGVVG